MGVDGYERRRQKTNSFPKPRETKQPSQSSCFLNQNGKTIFPGVSRSKPPTEPQALIGAFHSAGCRPGPSPDNRHSTPELCPSFSYITPVDISHLNGSLLAYASPAKSACLSMVGEFTACTIPAEDLAIVDIKTRDRGGMATAYKAIANPSALVLILKDILHQNTSTAPKTSLFKLIAFSAVAVVAQEQGAWGQCKTAT